MDKCELCGKGATLEQAFGGDSGPNGAHESDPAWLKLICPACARKASKRVTRDPYDTARPSELRAVWRRYVDPEGSMFPDSRRLRSDIRDAEDADGVLRGSFLDIIREGHN